MRHYSKILGFRAWSIVRRPVWRWIVGLGTFYTFLQLVAHYLAERIVGVFDALYQWWYVPIVVLALCVLLGLPRLHGLFAFKPQRLLSV